MGFLGKTSGGSSSEGTIYRGWPTVEATNGCSLEGRSGRHI